MDPNQTYLDMFAAMRDGDLATARELALALKHWFANGGFYPYQYTKEAMHAYIASVLRRTCGIDRDAFSLTCVECDAGREIATMHDALAAGWTDIHHQPELMEANYVGLCPECRAADC